MFTGSLALDLHLGDIHSLKAKRSVVRPIVAELRRKYEVSAAEAGYQDLHRRVAARPEVECCQPDSSSSAPKTKRR